VSLLLGCFECNVLNVKEKASKINLSYWLSSIAY